MKDIDETKGERRRRKGEGERGGRGGRGKRTWVVREGRLVNMVEESGLLKKVAEKWTVVWSRILGWPAVERRSKSVQVAESFAKGGLCKRERKEEKVGKPEK